MNKKSILIFIADDNCLLLEGLVSMLGEQEDFVVVGTAQNGRKAVEQIKDLKPEVALIDIGMPDKDGLEVTQALHQDLPNVKVIILGLLDKLQLHNRFETVQYACERKLLRKNR